MSPWAIKVLLGTALDPAGRPELHYAAAEGRADEARTLIQAGAEVSLADSQGMTPLHFAAQEHHVDVARVLLDAGAAVDATDQHGNTPLWKAVFSSNGRGELSTYCATRGRTPTSLTTTERVRCN